THLANALPGYIANAQHGRGWIGHLVTRYHIQSWVQRNTPKLVSYAQSLSKPALSIGAGALSLVIELLTIFFLVLLLLIEAPKMRAWILSQMKPARAAKTTSVANEVNHAVAGYMLGNLVPCLIAGIVVFVTLMVLGVPYPLLWGLWVALVDFLPMIGGALAGIPTALFAFTHSLTAGIVTAIVFLTYQQVENHILNPVIMSKTVKISPLLVLVAVLVGAAKSVLRIVLAGGAGTRLSPLTADRAKPAVPLGGLYRLIDFALSNLANGGIRKICLLTQYKSHSLDRHISTTWRMSSLLGNYVTPVPAQQRLGPHWYTGSADAIFQSMNLINDEQPDIVIVFGADHVYRMDPTQMVDHHVAHGAGVTVAAIPVPRAEGSAFGIVKVAADGRTIDAFLEKPADPPSMPGNPDLSYSSMGNYVFDTDVLVDALRKDADDDSSRHDIGGNIIPNLVQNGSAQAYDFTLNEVPGATPRDAGYWRDVGSLESYFDAHMDLCAVAPIFNLYNEKWPILTHVPSLPPAKFVHDAGDRVGRALDSLVSPGVVVSGGLVRQSVLSPGVRVHSWATVERSVLLHNTKIGRHALVRDAIIDKNVTVPEWAQVGVDKDHDRARGFVVSPGGITVVGKGQEVVP